MPSRRPSKTSLKAIDEAERTANALEMRKRGISFEQIRQELGYADASGPHKAVTRALQAMKREPAEELVTLELARLDHLFLVAYEQAVSGSLPAIDRCIRLMERRAAMLGLDNALLAFTGSEEIDVAAVAAQLAAEYPDLESSAVLAEVEQIIREAQR